jgi:hypothetical protein
MLRKLWFGVYSLPVAFWGFCVAGNLAVIFCAIFLGVLAGHMGLGTAGIALGALVIWAYWIVASVGVWKSADAYPYTKFWPVIVKGLVLLYWGGFIYRASTGGLEALMSKF